MVLHLAHHIAPASIVRIACLLTGWLFMAAAVAQQINAGPYVPSPQSVVADMLKVADIGPGDFVIDLGSGDGRIVVTAAKKHGARGFGVDINPERVVEALANAQKNGVTDKVAFYQRDLFQTDLSQATVISMYLLPRVNMELRPKLLDLKPGTRIVSHDFSMGDWKPDAYTQIYSLEKYTGSGGESEVYFWVVPAVWRWELPLRGGKMQSYAVTLNQTFQMVSGSVTVNGRGAALQNVKLSGDELSFSFSADLGAGPVRHEFKGKADGGKINGAGSLSGGRTQGRYDWNAERASVGTLLTPAVVAQGQ